MTPEEIEAYKQANEPTKVLTDKIGRWKRREWKIEGDKKIVERYKYDTEDDDKIKKNKDPRKFRNCFSVEMIIKDNEDE